MALSQRFQRVYAKLLSAFVSYDDAVKARAKLPELTRRHLEHHDARTHMSIVRTEDGHKPKERISPKYIDPSIGVGSAGLPGKISAVITGLVLVLGLVMVTYLIRDITG